MTTIAVKTSKPYKVVIGDGLIKDIGSLIQPVCATKKVAVITDDIVNRLYGSIVTEVLMSSGYSVSKFVFVNGEKSKNIVTLSKILEFLAESELTRSDMLIALGGGVVGDITGFAAAVYMRGIDFIQVPTTLLAAVDASVGGKTAIDLEHGKNLAGAFWQPRMVLCDTEIIRDLPDSLFANGMGEVIKHGVLAGADILDAIENGAEKYDFEWLVKRNIEIKRDIVVSDERESGKRRILNFGHTVAHAIEKMSCYTIPHGEAVGIGMVYETRLAEALGICESGLEEKILGYCDKYGLFTKQLIDDEFIKAMTMDKKNEDKKIVFALPERVGAFCIKKLTVDEVKSYLVKSGRVADE